MCRDVEEISTVSNSTVPARSANVGFLSSLSCLLKYQINNLKNTIILIGT